MNITGGVVLVGIQNYSNIELSKISVISLGLKLWTVKIYDSL